MWPVPGLPPLGSSLARMRDWRRDVGRHVDFWKLFLLYLLISFVCSSWGVGTLVAQLKCEGQRTTWSNQFSFCHVGPGVLRPPDLAASLTFIYSFSLECTWVFQCLRSGHHILWYELWAVLIELCSDPLPHYLNELFLSCSLWAAL